VTKPARERRGLEAVCRLAAVVTPSLGGGTPGAEAAFEAFATGIFYVIVVLWLLR
jgi:hypothetical protein